MCNVMFESRFGRSRTPLAGAWLVLAALLLAAGAQAQPPSPPEAETTITSDRMTVQNKEHRAVFEGRVVLTKGDLVVRSDVMVVFYRPEQHAPPGPSGAAGAGGGDAKRSHLAVSRIEATGRVKIEKDTGKATCAKAVFYQEEQRIVLTGDPVAWQRGNRVTGERITMFLDQDRTVVEGDSKVLLGNVQDGGS